VDIGTILGISESTVKKHLLEIFQALNVETPQRRRAARARNPQLTRRPSKAGLTYRCTRAPPPFINFSTSSFEAIDVSPGVVMASAPCAAP
jgi:hypothetical protein